ncbi:MAG: acyltransferase family protein [Thermoleophilia bacterium]|nr:acyltransferase family protein [Thermoleophilia bacterium]
MPGLDGLRAIAVIAVVLYHLNVGFVPGGLLGVGIFFTLSGYLITDILLEAWTGRRLKLSKFWLARARRLLPALFSMLVIVTVWVWIGDPGQMDNLRGLVLSSTFFTSNWWVIFQDVSYFDRFGPVSPLGHLWSLAIEEQFYIIWPFILLIGLKFVPPGVGTARSTRQRLRPRLAAVTLGLALVSVILMAVLYKPGFDMTRIYEGTDTRAFGLLLGAAVAMVWPSRRLDSRVTSKLKNQLDIVGVVSLIIIAILIWQTDQYSSFLYRGGLVLLSLATVALVAVMAHPASRLGPIIGCAPLRWIGVRSYAIYLWQLPIIALTTPPLQDGFSPVRGTIQVVAIFGISALSWTFLEDPVRQGAIGKLIQRWRDGWRPHWQSRTGAIGAFVALFLLITLAGLFGLSPSKPVAPLAYESTAADPPKALLTEAPPVVTTKSGTTEPTEPTDTECTSVAYIGDSTSVGLVSPDYLPDPADQLGGRLEAIGATDQHIDISGARSIYERVDGQPNAEDAAQAIKDGGFDGCWILGMGTNDTANQAVGSTIDSAARIERMMSVIGDEPALWINVKSQVPSGPYADANMKEWDDALLAACPSYSNMRVYDWRSKVKDEWFIEDGIHFTSDGYEARAQAIANAVTEAFPPWQLRRYKPDCLVPA